MFSITDSHNKFNGREYREDSRRLMEMTSHWDNKSDKKREFYLSSSVGSDTPNVKWILTLFQ